METQCSICDGYKWFDLIADPIPPWSNFLGDDSGEINCPVCNPDCSVSLDDIGDQIFEIPSWRAFPISGYHGKFTALRRWMDDGSRRTLVADRSWCPGLWDLPEDPRFQDCPLCHNWGVCSIEGTVSLCIACHGKPPGGEIKGYDPLYSWGYSWRLGHSKLGNLPLLTPRGYPGLEHLEKCREHSPEATDSMVAAIESIPGIVRLQ